MITVVITIVEISILLAMIYMFRKVTTQLQTEIDAAQQRLQAAKEKTEEVIPGLREGTASTFRIDRKNMVMYLQEEQAQKIGFAKNEWTVPTFRELCHSDSYDVFDKWINTYSLLHNPICRHLRFHISYDGQKTYHWFELIYKLDEITSKKPHFRGIFVGIDNIKQMENDIEDAMKKVYEVEIQENMLAAVNHDLRTPLNAVAGFARLLAEQYEDFSEEERQEFTTIVESNSEVLMQLISDVENMKADDTSGVKVKMRKKSVRELLNFTYQTNNVICPTHLAFILQEAEDATDRFINVDPKRVQQVLNNFLSNAFKFTQVGSVTLGWNYDEQTSEVELYVKDTGVGIKPEYHEKIFEQYFKIHEHAHGTGLGLNTCKNIVELQGGTIGVRSTYSKGSTFFCRFKTAE